jgi:pilus assembly protein CpaC
MKMRKTLNTVWTIITLAMLGCMTLSGLAPDRALAQSKHSSIVRISNTVALPATRAIKVGLNKSAVVELPRDIRDVLASDPKILDVVVNNSRRVYLIGTGLGQANVFFFDTKGNRILTLEVIVDRDPAPLERILNRLIDNAKITVEFINDTVVLTGKVPHASDSSRASDVASRFVVTDDPTQNTKYREKVINLLTVGSREQVLLKVTIMEMARTMIKQLGVNWDGNLTIGTGVFGFGSNPGFAFSQALANVVSPLTGTAISGRNGIGGLATGSNGTVVVNLRALEQNGLVRTLAEPTLTAISGETANFLAGGEFPIPIATDDDGISVEFKPFGVGLSFTPLVLSEGRISMKVSTEVSELSQENSVSLGLISIPGLKVRRAESTIELPSGGSLVMAGLISSETKQSMEGQPGLKNLPVLGALFRSRDFQKNETELVVIVTPYIVDPVARSKLVRPDKGFADASDAQSYLLGRLNRIYGRRPEEMPVGTYKGAVGFIVE